MTHLSTRSPLILCLLLAACGTPQEQCIARNTHDLTVIDRLIAETDANIRRGYALEQVTISTPIWEQCSPVAFDPKSKKRPAPPKLCPEDQNQTITRPAAIDHSAEQRKLNSLIAKRQTLLQAAQPMIAACKSQYPE